MTNKSSLTFRLRTAILAVATGLVGLTGCEAPQTQRQSIYQQTIPSYSQEQTQPQNQQQTQSDDNLEMSILGGVLGAGLVGAGLPANMNPMARVLADVGTRGIGNGILSDSSRPRTNVNVTVNGQPGYAQPMQAQTLDSRLLPEYNIDNLRAEWKKAEPKTNSTFQDGVFSLYTSRIVENLDENGIPTFMGARTDFSNSKNERVKIVIGYNVLGKSLLADDAMARHTISLKILNDDGEVVYRDEISGKGEKFEKRIAQLKLSGLNPGVYHVQCDYSSQKGHKSSKKAIFQISE